MKNLIAIIALVLLTGCMTKIEPPIFTAQLTNEQFDVENLAVAESCSNKGAIVKFGSQKNCVSKYWQHRDEYLLYDYERKVAERDRKIRNISNALLAMGKSIERSNAQRRARNSQPRMITTNCTGQWVGHVWVQNCNQF